MALAFTGRHSLGFKALIIGAIILLLLVPLTMLRELVSERTMRRDEAYTTVAQGWGGDQVLAGPVLIIPTERVIEADGRTRIDRSDIYVLPATLDADVTLTMESEPRSVGIYAVPVYLSHVHLGGSFDFAAARPLLGRSEVTYLWDEARIRLPLSDVRSLREMQVAQLDGAALKFRPATLSVSSVDAPIMAGVVRNAVPVRFTLDLVLAGSRSFSIQPFGSTTTVTLKSNWPHPSFRGAFLPVERSIADSGFEARWQILELNRPYGQAWEGNWLSPEALDASTFGVGLYQAVDVYQRGERAIKYALLFIALTFLTFFAWERVSGLRIHLLQYLLVGLALSVFYLLLVALSEHVKFGVAYLIAAAALVLLIAIYLGGALHSRHRGIVAGGVMSAVYGLLYMLVLSEDYALLLGAIILFAALAGVMLATRRVDWYGSDELPAQAP
jgi:inner membrane protein